MTYNGKYFATKLGNKKWIYNLSVNFVTMTFQK